MTWDYEPTPPMLLSNDLAAVKLRRRLRDLVEILRSGMDLDPPAAASA